MHKGIYLDVVEDDIQTIFGITKICLDDWNDRFSKEESVILSCNPESPIIACTVGSKVLAAFAPEKADAYKRVATLLVTMSLSPFVVGEHSFCDANQQWFTEKLQGDRLRVFGIAFLVDSLSAYFAPFEQQKTATEWVRMNKFPGFRLETRNELIALLFSFSRSYGIGLTGGFDTVALAQSTLGISLILKAIYPI